MNVDAAFARLVARGVQVTGRTREHPIGTRSRLIGAVPLGTGNSGTQKVLFALSVQDCRVVRSDAILRKGDGNHSQIV